MTAALGLGPVVYEPPLTRSAPWGRQPKVLRTGPRWIRGASRWHRVRSATVYDHGPCWQMWCGQTRFDRDRPDRTDAPPTDGLPLCGTCEGRAVGAGHTSPLGISKDTLLFRPARLTPPRWCPGGGPYGPAQHLAQVVGHRVVCCGACGELVAERNAYGWNARGGLPRQHLPGSRLVPGCPQHAWRHLVHTVEGVACRCAGLEAA